MYAVICIYTNHTGSIHSTYFFYFHYICRQVNSPHFAVVLPVAMTQFVTVQYIVYFQFCVLHCVCLLWGIAYRTHKNGSGVSLCNVGVIWITVSVSVGGVCTGCTNKNNPLEKMLYFSHGSTDLSQTFRLCIGVLIQHIL